MQQGNNRTEGERKGRLAGNTRRKEGRTGLMNEIIN